MTRTQGGRYEPYRHGRAAAVMSRSSARRVVLIAALAVGAGLIWLVDGLAPGGRGSGLGLGAAVFASPALALPGPLGSLRGKGPWLNSPPLRAEDVRGKVVLVNFWTYSCINSLRPLPYVRAWAAKYKDRGLVVIGVHTPEFGFEKDLANVRRAVAELGVGYPVVLDSDYAIWRAFDNNAWPAFYFIGADGRVRKQVLGEGHYDASERLIQALLSQADHAPVTDRIVPVVGSGPQAAPDWRDLGSEETYVGFAKATGFASEGGQRPERASVYQAPRRLAL